MKKFIILSMFSLVLGWNTTATAQTQTNLFTSQEMEEIVATTTPFEVDTLKFNEKREGLIEWVTPESSQNCAFDFVLSYYCGFTNIFVVCPDGTCTSFVLENSNGVVVGAQSTNITMPGTYEMTVMGLGGCTSVANVNVTVIFPTIWYADADGDSFGNPFNTTQACAQPMGYVANNTDCDDNDPLEKPGQVWFKDTDNDGYAQTGAATITQCLRPAGYKVVAELISTTGDCNDNNAAIKPGATEVCDGVDNNCNGVTDEGVQITYYRDADGDGYGNVALTQIACTQPVGYVTNNTDCNDNNPTINPAAVEICDGLIDNNCDWLILQCTTVVVYVDTCIGGGGPTCNLSAIATATSPTCIGGTGNVNLAISGAQGLTGSFLWSNGAITQNIGNVPAGNYCVTVTDGIGCIVVSCATVLQGTLQQPVATFSYTTGSGMTVGFSNQSTNSVAWLWEFGDGTTSTSQNPGSHTYLQPGVYFVTLTAANNCGSNTIMQTVIVEEPTPSCNQTGITNTWNMPYGATVCPDTMPGQLILTAPGFPSTTNYVWSGSGDLGDGQYFPNPDFGPHFVSVWVTEQGSQPTQYCFAFTTVDCDPVTGTEQIENRGEPEDTTVYPNPVKGEGELRIKGLRAGTYIAKIFSIDGRSVSTETIVIQ